MAIAETLVAKPPPLEWQENGRVLRVRGTRIPLDRIVYALEQGASAQDIVTSYPTLRLADVHAVISYYLDNRDEVMAYLRQREREEEGLRQEIEAQWPSSDLRERLESRLSEAPDATPSDL